MARFENKVALVTGAARGIGRATAAALAAEGASVALTDIRDEECRAAAAEIASDEARTCFIHHDVTREEEWEDLFGRVEGELGPVDIVINNAGIVEVGSVEDTTWDQWRRVMSVNSDGVFLGTRAAIRHMKAHDGGAIVNVSSIEGLIGNPILAAYNASKGAVRLLTKSAALHCADRNYKIRVNSIHPGFTLTALVEDALPLAPEGFVERTLAETPAGRFASAEEVAKGILFLVSDDASYVTGAELALDGGYTCR